MSSAKRKIELLAPARDYRAAIAAVDCGADALYIGAEGFGARRAATNSTEDIARVVAYAHLFGVRVYVTLNTILYESELKGAERLARELIAVGVDALIVQDMAYREMGLPVELHASTQVCNMTAEGARFLEDSGFTRVILERALSLDEIGDIRRATTVDLECFIHGAICVGHSGHCYLSRSQSSRSGNRGECSQPCRLTYDLVTEQGERLIRGKHLLSVKDFDLSQRIGELIDAGVMSFKIEGRLKDDNYIKNVVSYYRRKIDEALASRPDCCRLSVGCSEVEFDPDPKKSFTRDGGEYMLLGKRAGVASFNTPKAVGEYIGRVRATERRRFRLDGRMSLNAGDGLCFVTRDGILGTNVNSVEGDAIEPNRMDGIKAGMEVYRNYDHRFAQLVERSRIRRTVDTECVVSLSGEGIVVRYTDCEGLSVELRRDVTLDRAKSADKMRAVAEEQMSKSGDSIFRVSRVEVVGAEWFATAKMLAELRREALSRLASMRAERELPHDIRQDDGRARYPLSRLTPQHNVVNSLARRFYERHGVEHIVEGLDLCATTVGQRVMESSYCLRREIGECLKRGSKLRDELYLEHGRHRYRLAFDCAQCRMSLIDCTEKETFR
ncbi:MAG: U32 family peptidase [Alistipes sp.]|nr:U32 family peptidase [Alistipes sp.]